MLEDRLKELGDKKVEIPAGLALRLYAAMATGSYVPSMFSEVRDLMINLDALLGACHEDQRASGTDSDGAES